MAITWTDSYQFPVSRGWISCMTVYNNTRSPEKLTTKTILVWMVSKMDEEVGIILPPRITFFVSLNRIMSGTTWEMPISAQSLTLRGLPGRCGLFSVADTEVTSSETAQCLALRITKETAQRLALCITKEPWLFVFQVLP